MSNPPVDRSTERASQRAIHSSIENMGLLAALLDDAGALRNGVVLLEHCDGLVDLGLQRVWGLDEQQQLRVVHL